MSNCDYHSVPDKTWKWSVIDGQISLVTPFMSQVSTGTATWTPAETIAEFTDFAKAFEEGRL